MKIQVTQEDIDKGISASPKRCPIARAMRRTTGRGFSVGCDSLFDSDNGWDWPLPSEAVSFIRVFDCQDGIGAKPFEFELDMPGMGQPNPVEVKNA